MFGDMVDTSSMLGLLRQVNLGDGMGKEEHIKDTVLGGRPDGHRHAFESFAYFEDPVLYRYPAFVPHSPDQVIGSVIHRWQCFGKGAGTCLVSASRGNHAQGFMRPFQVVDRTPMVEALLAMCQVSETSALQHL